MNRPIDVTFTFTNGDREVTLAADNKESKGIMAIMFGDRSVWQAVRHGESIVLRPVTPKGPSEPL